MFRLVLATLLSGMVGAAALAASPDNGSATAMPGTPDQVFSSVLRQSIGAPARADIGDQATVRLSDDLMLVPREPASRLLSVSDKPVPPNFQALLLGSEGMEAPGMIRFVPAGFVDSDAALAWTPEDMLSSLRDTVERGNPDRLKQNLDERDARRWIQPPHYNPETHQLSWAALILPKSAPRESDGEVTFHAIGFGREGYVELTVVTGVQKTEAIEKMTDGFLAGLNFRPGKAYGDALPADKRAPGGLARVMEVDSLHKAETNSNFWASDSVVPVTGAIVASIGALSLLIYIQRHRRRESRRV